MSATAEESLTLGIIAARGLEGNPVTFIEPDLGYDEPEYDDPADQRSDLKRIEIVLGFLTFVVLLLTLINSWK